MINVGDKVRILKQLISGTMGLLPIGTEGTVRKTPAPPSVEYEIGFISQSLYQATTTFCMDDTEFQLVTPLPPPVSKYWTVFTPGGPPYSVGDRVQRTDVDNPGTVPAGTAGTVREVTSDSLSILWDHNPVRSEPYLWPLRAAYFSKISTRQPTAPVLCCSRCGEYNEYAQANQPDGTHKCWLCRQYRFR